MQQDLILYMLLIIVGVNKHEWQLFRQYRYSNTDSVIGLVIILFISMFISGPRPPSLEEVEIVAKSMPSNADGKSVFSDNILRIESEHSHSFSECRAGRKSSQLLEEIQSQLSIPWCACKIVSPNFNFLCSRRGDIFDVWIHFEQQA
jgi:hypothetical protein